MFRRLGASAPGRRAHAGFAVTKQSASAACQDAAFGLRESRNPRSHCSASALRRNGGAAVRSREASAPRFTVGRQLSGPRRASALRPAALSGRSGRGRPRSSGSGSDTGRSAAGGFGPPIPVGRWSSPVAGGFGRPVHGRWSARSVAGSFGSLTYGRSGRETHGLVPASGVAFRFGGRSPGGSARQAPSGVGRARLRSCRVVTVERGPSHVPSRTLCATSSGVTTGSRVRGLGLGSGAAPRAHVALLLRRVRKTKLNASEPSSSLLRTTFGPRNAGTGIREPRSRVRGNDVLSFLSAATRGLRSTGYAERSWSISARLWARAALAFRLRPVVGVVRRQLPSPTLRCRSGPASAAAPLDTNGSSPCPWTRRGRSVHRVGSVRQPTASQGVRGGRSSCTSRRRFATATSGSYAWLAGRRVGTVCRQDHRSHLFGGVVGGGQSA